MTATLQLRKKTGAGPTDTSISLTAAAIFHSADTIGTVATDTIAPVSAGTTNSWWTVLRPNVSANPSVAETVSGLSIYFERADIIPSGIDIRVARATAYDQAVNDDDLTTYTGIVTGGIEGSDDGSAKDHATSVTAIALDGSETGTGEGDGGDEFDYVILQLDWDAGSDLGILTEIIIVLEYSAS